MLPPAKTPAAPVLFALCLLMLSGVGVWHLGNSRLRSSSRQACPRGGGGSSTASMPVANGVPPVLRRPACLLFGDSLTERAMDSDRGWGAALAHHFGRKFDVLNRGFGGACVRLIFFWRGAACLAVGERDPPRARARTPAGS